MKILHLVWGMKMGGVETMLVNIINEQVKTDQVYLLIVNDFVDEGLLSKVDRRCIIKRINRQPKSRNYFNVLKLNAWIVSKWPDIIHVHSYRLSKLIYGNWKIVRTIHNTKNKAEEYPRMKALYAISNAVTDYTRKQGFSNVKCVYNGILTSEIRRKQVLKPGNDFYKIVQVSRLYIKQKGQDVLLKALNILVYTHGITNFSLHFIGVGPSEDMLKGMVKDLGLEDYVHFEGLRNQEYIYNHLCDYDLFVQPSRFEGFGITVAEALAAKVPVIVSDIEGPMEIIGNGKFGMSFVSENIEDLANKIKTVLQGGYDYSLIEKAYQHACCKYDVKRTTKQYIDEYKKVINN